VIHDFVHISDLHIGLDAETNQAAERICAALLARRVGLTILTGDVTHRGRKEELAEFERIFAPLLAEDRLVLVPGNHDRMGDDCASTIMRRSRVDVVMRPGLYLVRLDSTAPYNRSPIASHGLVTPSDIEEVGDALAEAPRNVLSVLMLHHHVLPLPEDRFAEKLSNMLGWPYAAELRSGRELVERILGRCDLVLHGHRHKANELQVALDRPRPLQILNAGSSTALGWWRHLVHQNRDILASSWMDDGQRVVRPIPQPTPAVGSSGWAGGTSGFGAAASPHTAP
jgi:3',5'-cyclic AMP phosphodiesterase CpdA